MFSGESKGNFGKKSIKNYNNFQIDIPKECFSINNLRYFERCPSGLIILKQNDNFVKYSTLSLI